MQQQQKEQYIYIDYTQEIEILNKIDKQIENQQKQIEDDSDWGNILNFMKEQVIQLLKDKPQRFFIMNKQESMEFTRLEAFTYLSLMFFELTIEQENYELQHKFNFLYNMKRLKNEKNKLATQKLKCIKCYLKIIYQQPNLREQKITITKLKLKNQEQFEKWKQSNSPIAEFELSNKSMFEFQNKNFVNFADPFIGGLCLDGMNCAQEEVLMCLHPEAIIAQLFFTRMEDDEAIYFENLLRSCNFSGYEQTFNCIPIKENDQRPENIIAIDAYSFGYEDQFEQKWIKREINKAFTGFQVSRQSDKDIVSGKWGCGVFRGKVILKMLIQIAAFSEAVSQNQAEKKPKLILTFFHDQQFQQYEKLYEIRQKYKTVGELVQHFKDIYWEYKQY